MQGIILQSSLFPPLSHIYERKSLSWEVGREAEAQGTTSLPPEVRASLSYEKSPYKEDKLKVDLCSQDKYI